jgi:hypothetical protein
MYMFLMLMVSSQKASDEFGWNVVMALSRGWLVLFVPQMS